MLVARRRLVAGTGLAGLVGGLSRRAWGEGPPGLCTPSVPQAPTVDRPPPQRNAEDFSEVEVGMAFRNHGMLAELLKSDLTPLGAHYLLVHFDVPALSADGYSVALGGRVQSPRAIPLAEIRAAPELRQVVTMECAGVGRRRLGPRPLYVPWEDEEIGTYQWVGTPLRPFLERAGLDPSAVEVLFTGWDSGVDQGVEHAFERSMPVADAMRPEVMLVWGANGQDLLPEHGFPLRLVVPSWYGMASVKWLRAITVLGEPFRGVQQTRAYVYERVADDPNAAPVREKRVKSVMVPPGVPDVQSGWRLLAPGPVTVEGLAWSGQGAVAAVQVSADGGASRGDAQLSSTSPDPYAWVRWRFAWNAGEGHATLVCRAQDSSGAVQPLDPQAVWNYGGNGVNAAQRVEVVAQPGVGSAARAVPCAPRAALPGADGAGAPPGRQPGGLTRARGPRGVAARLSPNRRRRGPAPAARHAVVGGDAHAGREPDAPARRDPHPARAARRRLPAQRAALGAEQVERGRERQLEGVKAAKARGVYTGRRPSVDAAEVRRLREREGLGPAAIARRLGVGRASVSRVLGKRTTTA